MDALREFLGALESEGYSIRREALVRGASGLRHVFSAIVNRGGGRILVEYAGDERELLRALGKAVDVSGEKVLLLVDDRVYSVYGDNLGDSIKVVKIGDVERILSSIEKMLE